MVTVEEPTSYSETATETMWKEIVQKELEAIEKNKSWTITNLSSRHKPIDLKWVFKLKRIVNEMSSSIKQDSW